MRDDSYTQGRKLKIKNKKKKTKITAPDSAESAGLSCRTGEEAKYSWQEFHRVTVMGRMQALKEVKIVFPLCYPLGIWTTSCSGLQPQNFILAVAVWTRSFKDDLWFLVLNSGNFKGLWFSENADCWCSERSALLSMFQKLWRKNSLTISKVWSRI